MLRVYDANIAVAVQVLLDIEHQFEKQVGHHRQVDRQFRARKGRI